MSPGGSSGGSAGDRSDDRPGDRSGDRQRAAWRGLAALSAFVLGALAANGYRFGVSDHAIHLPFLLRTRDPSFLVGDPAVDALAHHPTLFWELQAPLLSWISIEALYVAIHVASLAALFGGVRALGRALFPGHVGDWVVAVAPALVVIGHVTGAGIVSMDAQVLNRTVSLGPLLYALALGARGAHLRGFAVAGVTFWIHPTTALHAAALLWCVAWVPRTSRARVRAALLGPLAFVTAASPLIVSMVIQQSGGGVPFPGPPAWWDFVRLNMYFHIHPLDAPWGLGPVVLLYGLVCFVIGRRGVPSAARAYLLGVAGCCAAGFLGTSVIRIPQVVFLHLWESLRFLVFIAAVCCAAWAVRAWHGTGGRGTRAAVVLFALALALDLPFFIRSGSYARWVHEVFAIAALVGCGALAWRARAAHPGPCTRPPPWWLGVGSPAAVALLRLALGPGDEQPAFVPLHPGVFQHRFADAPEDVALAAWCREHLPADALVLLPLEWDGLLHFRYGARRAVFVTLKDGPESVFDLRYHQEYRRRVEAACDCRPFELARYGDARGRARMFREFDVIGEGVRAMTGERARRLRREYGVTHIVAAASAAAAELGEILYRDPQYVVVRITMTVRPPGPLRP
jgi:hypothetical protein